ncbi:MAG: methionyl-tRNA formyltransferase, partial [Muribaculaceae bacterium]|nr:methionyl-tRNA formyltransferase [Muribaculaceae bacterium]
AAWSVLREPDGKETEMMIFATRRTDETSTLPAGSLLPGERRMAVACGDGGVLEVLSVRPAGRKRMDAADYLRGARLAPGAKFE